MTSDRFQRALKEYLDRERLAQDDTIDKAFETTKAGLGNLYRIGKEEGLDDEYIVNEIRTLLSKKTEKQNLFDMLSFIMGGSTLHTEGNAKTLDADVRTIPHDKAVVLTILQGFTKKFDSCTEQERRAIHVLCWVCISSV